MGIPWIGWVYQLEMALERKFPAFGWFNKAPYLSSFIHLAIP
jgi:hypothetical protein